jgi:protein-S-isoprenylcysteine O-methyltransferase Ste14
MIAFGAMELFLRSGASAKSVKPQATDRGTSALIVAAYALAVLAIATPLLPSVPVGAFVSWAGVGVGIAGYALRVWAMRVLGRFYTRTLMTTGDQSVVQDGPYRLVRHPGYLGSMLVWIGASTASGNLLSVAAVVILLGIAYTMRIRAEERMLIEALGAPYEQYRRRTSRLVPFVF